MNVTSTIKQVKQTSKYQLCIARSVHFKASTSYVVIYYYANKVHYKKEASYELFMAMSRQSHSIDQCVFICLNHKLLIL